MAHVIRHAESGDLERINSIYNSYIVDDHTSFDAEPWRLDDRVRWFESYAESGRYQVLVLELDGSVMGFASSSRFRGKAGYDRSVETTVVLDGSIVGKGWGRQLLEALLGRLHHEDVHRAYALIALPNEGSVALHEALGYRRIGVLDEVGYKLGRWHSVLVMELPLGDSGAGRA